MNLQGFAGTVCLCTTWCHLGQLKSWGMKSFELLTYMSDAWGAKTQTARTPWASLSLGPTSYMPAQNYQGACWERERDPRWSAFVTLPQKSRYLCCILLARQLHRSAQVQREGILTEDLSGRVSISYWNMNEWDGIHWFGHLWKIQSAIHDSTCSVIVKK